MPEITCPQLGLKLLERIHCLKPGEVLHAKQMHLELDQVVTAMAELLKSGLALGWLTRGADGIGFIDASVFALTEDGRTCHRALRESSPRSNEGGASSKRK